ncbi:SH3-like domain-containing protein [Actinomadura syzygii]|uniref:Nitrile hydratase subunit beta n=1 Tax=Actinomadura syzygii TaxID=1427538 RepID=A0A5D0U9K6_9ACTN|nr:SH3-like domain-containing protein [Actinomadura syzygii]TYC14322.1 nitrile hydratase subunit beta [Actinomadura syzygii]
MANPRFSIGDEVTVRDETTLFHTRTQKFARGRTGVVVEHRPEWVIPEDEAFDRMETGRKEPFYVVRFKQTELWPGYTGQSIDTLESEFSERWLVPA